MNRRLSAPLRAQFRGGSPIRWRFGPGHASARYRYFPARGRLRRTVVILIFACLALLGLTGCSDGDPGLSAEAGAADAGGPDLRRADAALPGPALTAQLPSWAVVVPMTLAGQGSATAFLLDTGADVLRLSPAFAQKLGTKTVGSLTFGASTLSDVPYAVYDTTLASSLLGVALDGIAGNRVFSSLAVAIDYRKALVYPLAAWRADYAFGDHLAGSFSTVPVTLAGPTKLLLCKGRFESQQKEVAVVLDSGTSSAVISQSLFSSLGLDKDGRTVLKGSKAISSLGNIDSPIVRLRSFRLGSAPAAQQMWATVMPDLLFQALALQTGAPVQAIIGGGYFREFLTVLDYPGKAVHLRPYAQLSHIGAEFQMVGVEVRQKAGAFVVFSVFEGSDAGAKGIAVDDELVSVDGQSLATKTLAGVRALLSGTPGSTVALTLENATKGSYSVTVQRDDLLPPLQ